MDRDPVGLLGVRFKEDLLEALDAPRQSLSINEQWRFPGVKYNENYNEQLTWAYAPSRNGSSIS